MDHITFNNVAIHTKGHLPIVGTKAPDFVLTGKDLKDFRLKNFEGKKLVLNIFPSIDTSVCAASVRKFNSLAAQKDNTVVLCISKDLPFAQNRFCGAEGIENITMGSEFRNNGFSDHYHVEMVDGPLMGLMSRAVIVLDATHHVLYTEQVSDISQEPNYEAALSVL